MTPGQLVSAVALALDVPEETVIQHDRNLVVAGLRTKGGRGRSAPAVTALDAARLFVAVLGAVRAKDSVSVVRYFEEALFNKPMSMAESVAEWRREGITLPGTEHKVHSTETFSDPALNVLPDNHNFVEAIAALIGDASLPVGDENYLRRFAPMVIDCDNSGYSAAHIGRYGGPGSVSYRRLPIRSEKKTKESAEPRPYHVRYAWSYGIRQKRHVTGTAIMLLGKAFRDGGLPFDSTRDALADLYGTAPKSKAKSKKKVP